MSGHAVAVSHPCRQVDNRSVSDPELTESLQHRPDIHYSARSRKDQGTVLTRLQYVVLMQSRDAVYCYMRCGVVCLCLCVGIPVNRAKRMNRSKCRLGGGARPEEPCTGRGPGSPNRKGHLRETCTRHPQDNERVRRPVFAPAGSSQ